nr:MAG TPA: hypothetical protein [Caudoviricetes sp.]
MRSPIAMESQLPSVSFVEMSIAYSFRDSQDNSKQKS